MSCGCVLGAGLGGSRRIALFECLRAGMLAGAEGLSLSGCRIGGDNDNDSLVSLLPLLPLHHHYHISTTPSATYPLTHKLTARNYLHFGQ